ncbi:glycine--tRNA ligase subunit beta [Novosphingobium humi]|uniref:Glycine--tRNA ligase beta subunit n=1 Tax=Novosphingobium humi TaxID=2282397 RepID=A0ABY7TYT9_9SPHN|nr:glycine--tRNA ligase subunit beta [Novosphingobium humi]WCT78437.1 glycine--tRNA ligase subunit beta [Novosphingobium humi]
MSDFLLELRSEEIPARMQAGARAELEKLFRGAMAAAGVAVGELVVWSTPRRLALIARGLPVATQAVREEVKGPKASAPEQALAGFLRKTGLTREQLEERDGVLFAVTEKPGRATADVLAEAIPAIVRGFSWPKSQRWGAASLSTESLRWVRPLQGIVALLDGAVVECEVGGIVSGRETVGHRFHSSGAVTVADADSYADDLRAAHVLVNHNERQDIIRAKAKEAASAAGLTLVEDEGLVIENAGLTEWPQPLLGRFDEAFLEVPPEVIQLTARVNQKYFVCEDAAGKLANAFVCTANIDATDGGAGIIDGNRKVLAARLSDARFFWQQDLKTPLADQAKKLERITFHEKLGTVADKVARVAKLAEWLASEGIVPGADPASARQAAELCKADLVTEMVGEFPELQGLMGGYYARAEGLPDAVADAIRDHYKPVGQGDDVPTAPVTVCVALADKIDTIAAFFLIGEKPTGSKDPYALRRATLASIGLILAKGVRVSLRKLLLEAGGPVNHQLFPPAGQGQEEAMEIVHAASRQWVQFQAAVDEIITFFADRLKVQQKEAGVRHDLIDAVFALGGEDDLVRLLARVHALQAFVQTDDGKNLLAGYKRAANILKAEEKKGWDADVTNPAPEPAEAALIAALADATPKAEAAVAAEDFTGAMAALATLRSAVDDFFNDVTVNAEDPSIRSARLGLLSQLRAATHKVADFSRIEG